ncbi:flippase [Flavobacterium saccharophilum]|uniref:Polysaccharide transporter, PST family n=1 Tax=Flavobacterium saccharophilum TaxID=29534 RepID=A0A1M7K9T3_9FLAO|nr:flippase [Flavobacterium saccharophilum]SHM62059.1 polysaccharide transporter, PST family [Flavobacterium saccharophilum]
MFKNRFNFINNEEGKSLIKNFSFLFSVNIVNFVLPLLTFPYLVRVLGIEKFGLLSFATSIITYFLILTDYGFNLTATREISINRNDKNKLNEIFSAVMSVKVIIMTIGFVVLLPLIFFIPKFNFYWYIFIFSYGSVLGQVLFPIWFFQGLEEMKVVSILNILSKSLFTVAIFVFIKNEKDFYLVPIFSSLGFVFIGVISIIIVKLKHEVRFIVQSRTVLLKYLIEGWHLFLSNISVTLYTTATITFLGFYTNNTIVGYYSVADKIISAIRGVIAPISQVLFPYLCNIAKNNPKKVYYINRKLAIFGGGGMLLVSFILFVFASDIILLIFGKKDFDSILILKIFAIIPFLTFLHTVFALFTMIVFGKNKEYSKIIISAAILNILLCIILIPCFGYIGAAVAVIVIELFLLIRYISFTHKNDLRLFFLK